MIANCLKIELVRKYGIKGNIYCQFRQEIFQAPPDRPRPTETQPTHVRVTCIHMDIQAISMNAPWKVGQHTDIEPQHSDYSV